MRAVKKEEKIFKYRGSNYIITEDSTRKNIIKELEELKEAIIEVIKNSPNQVFKGGRYDIADILDKEKNDSHKDHIADFVSKLNDESILKEIYMVKGDYCDIHGALKNIFVEKCIVLSENKDFDHVNIGYEEISQLIDFT